MLKAAMGHPVDVDIHITHICDSQLAFMQIMMTL